MNHGAIVRTRPALRFGRRVFRKVHPDEDFLSYAAVEVSGQAASDRIRASLEGDEPAFIGRLGSTELTCIRNYLGVHGDGSNVRRSIAFIRGEGGPLWWEEGNLTDLTLASGFFPRDVSLIERFCAQLLDDMTGIDILGSWMSWERLVATRLGQAVRVRLRDLEPYYHDNPWTESLKGRTVLVVHPFVESIAAQYARRDRLFADSRVLPEFTLKTLKTVGSFAGSDTEFATWFEAYDHMCNEMSRMTWDVALIGAGAYGFPLAAEMKRLGRKAVHLGGAIQILFGIKGKRWDDHPVIARLYNEYWVRPRASERPASYLSVEGGCYW
jgi:hypothetical protein